jgi:hypothetical protein
MVTYKEFKIDDLFDVAQGRRLKKSDFQDGDIPFVMASSKNNGVVAYLSNPVTTNTNFITADILGNVFYQDSLVGYGDDNCGLKLKNGHESEAVYLYLTTVISNFKPIASYGNKLRGKWYAEQNIQLPVKPGTDEVNYSEADIDWDYMEQYIREIELAYIAELEETRDREVAAYLQETGLNDTRLTAEEQQILSAQPTYGEFKVEDLFDKLDLKRIKPTFDKKSDLSKVQTEEFDLPLVNAKAGNNGIMYYGRSGDWGTETMTIDIVNDGAVSAGMVYAQPQATGTLYNAYQIKLKAEVLSEVTVPQLLFLATTIQKSIQHKYNYSNKAVWSKVSSELIKLPLKPGTTTYSEADIDWDYMEAYIRAIEKQVIANVVTYKDTFIAKAKEIVN